MFQRNEESFCFPLEQRNCLPPHGGCDEWEAGKAQETSASRAEPVRANRGLHYSISPARNDFQGPTGQRERRSDFPKSPTHTDTNWKSRDSSSDHLSLRSRLFFTTPNNWHKQLLMCQSLISFCLLHFIKSLPHVLGTMRDYTSKANLLIWTCQVKS